MGERTQPVETWRAVVGFEGLYEVSDLGRVRSLPRVVSRCDGRTMIVAERTLTRRPGHGGYVLAELWRNNKVHKIRVHTLVLTAFVGPCPDGMECLHGSGGPSDNRLQNLRWGTSSENKYDTVTDGNHHNGKKKACKRKHLLTGANLRTCEYRGRIARSCRACGIANNKARYEASQGRSVDVDALADERYRQLMAG